MEAKIKRAEREGYQTPKTELYRFFGRADIAFQEEREANKESTKSLPA